MGVKTKPVATLPLTPGPVQVPPRGRPPRGTGGARAHTSESVPVVMGTVPKLILNAALLQLK